MQENFTSEQFLDRAKQTNLDMATKLKISAKHHIDSFNYITDVGLEQICKYLTPMELFNEQKDDKKSYLPFNHMSVWFEELELGQPIKNRSSIGDVESNRVMPKECRIAKKTYGAPLYAKIGVNIDGNHESIKVDMGDIPIIVMSDKCHLSKMNNWELVHEAHEDCHEFGGYFIINGNEKIIRMLILQKRNYPIAFIRPGYVNRGPNYTHFAVQSKCTRPDLTSKTITLHYVSDGNVFLRILHRKQEFLIPVIVILKALVDVSDILIYNKLVKGEAKKSSIHDRVEVLLRGGKATGLTSRDQCLAHLGSKLRIVLNITNPELNDKQVGEIFLNENICIHLDNNKDKFNFICLMINKLYAMVSNEINPDNLDSLQNQEVLLPGHLYMMFLREKLEESLLALRAKIYKDGQKSKDAQKTIKPEYFQRSFQQFRVGDKIEYLLSTGNLKSNTGLDLMQAKGFSIIADKLNNMRYMSHFRSIHRGAYFAEMKTTTVRKLLPELWGFICPVHTPDGGPCGLLQHISSECIPLTKSCYDPEKHCDIKKILIELGMSSDVDDLQVIYPADNYPVLLDGKIIGYLEEDMIETVVNSLRVLKVKQDPNHLIPKELEIGYVPKTKFDKNPTYPGLYLATNEARFVRPVNHLKLKEVEWVSPFEQPWLSIAVMEEDIREDTEYQEISYKNTLSILATMIPFLNYNQSPRNMYQCQMAKQTMGTSMHNFPHRFDNKIYRLMNGQIPLVKGFEPEKYGFPDYPSGMNAVVAVISYTGYDMEDACIINKSSYERGFGHGCVYKNYTFEVNEVSRMDDKHSKYKFRMLQHEKMNIDQNGLTIADGIQIDGVPRVGTPIKKGTAVFSVYDTTRNNVKTYYHKENEPGILDGVALVQGDVENDIKIQYRVRFPRKPVIGDKFSSRHGQKGVLSVLWPYIDMPFTESGITPDLIINPHAFPSRMTIGMLIESMAGKNAALNGEIYEYRPFEPFQDDDVVNYFGKQLVQNGYQYSGNEQMYNGTYGTAMKCDIFIGNVYYQRLRHMVSDKSQARSTGPVDILTQQPIKGRKRGGGIRMGEMERDALLAHGISFALHDRFMQCSDYSEGYVCNQCGSMISAYPKTDLIKGNQLELYQGSTQSLSKNSAYCSSCKTNNCSRVRLPFVLRYLTNELAAMNVKLTYKLK